MRLTSQTIAEITCPPGKSDYVAWDDVLPNFGLRCRPSGVRRWIVQYEIAGQQRKITIADPAIIGPDEARRLARIELAKRALGRDPAQERAEERAAAKQTFGSTVERYLADREGKIRPASMKAFKYYLLQWWEPLHRLPLHKVARRDVAVHLSGPPVAAGCARKALSAFYTWAIKQGLADFNPVIGTIIPDEHIKSRERVLSKAELAAVWRACGNDTFSTIVKLLILTAARRNEVGSLRWDELDPETGVWVVAPARTKSGRPLALPLPELAWSIIAEIPRWQNGTFVFGRMRGFTSWAFQKHAFDQRAGIKPWRLHDLRRTTASGLGELGTLPHIVSEILGHARPGVTGAVYNKADYSRQVAVALERWADHVRSLIEGGERKVIPLR
jgi:integrase